MGTDFNRVLDFYDKSADGEISRSERPSSRFEMLRALSTFIKYVQPPANVLDLGAGSGRYSIALSKLGFRVTVADLSPALLAIAREKIVDSGVEDNICSYDEVNAIDLSLYSEAIFDVVLSFGPFYHLAAHQERIFAANEIKRVLRPGGIIIAMFIPLLSGLNGFVRRGAEKPENFTTETLRGVYKTGTFINANLSAKDQKIMHFMSSKEVRELFEGAGFDTLDMLSLRGYTRGNEECLLKIEESNPDLYDEYLRIIEDTCREAGSIELGGHALYIGKKN